MKKNYILIIAAMMLSISMPLLAKDIDQERMNRDLEIAKNILTTLLKAQSERYVSSKSIDATYIKDYGIIFNVPQHATQFFIRSGKEKVIGYSNEGGIYVIEDKKNGYTIESTTPTGSSKEKVKVKGKDKDIEFDSNVDIQVGDGSDSGELERIYISFLADYVDVIGQLQPEHRIIINQQGDDHFRSMTWTSSSGDSDVEIVGGNFSIEAKKANITAYKSGKIDLDEFTDRLSIKKSVPVKKVADLEIYANVFKQYFSKSLSKTYFTEGTPKYEVLEQFGVIYNVRLYSSYQRGDNKYTMPTLGNDTFSDEERKAKIEELYPAFLADLKGFIIDYGRTIRSVGEDEMLMMKIQMTRCRGCSVPEVLEVSVKMNTLLQYDQQKISRDKALASINVN